MFGYNRSNKYLIPKTKTGQNGEMLCGDQPAPADVDGCGCLTLLYSNG